jgi:hypothetical protein
VLSRFLSRDRQGAVKLSTHGAISLIAARVREEKLSQ